MTERQAADRRSRQLASIEAELEAARAHVRRLADQMPEDRWSERPSPGRWSVAECVAHLNLTSEAYLPLIDGAMQRARRLQTSRQGRYRCDPIGWLLCMVVEPPARLRVTTPARFVPASAASKADLLAAFDRLQAEVVARLRDADGLPISSVKIRSPFEPPIRYNLYACFKVIAAHQRRHLWQAEQVRQLLAQPPNP